MVIAKAQALELVQEMPEAFDIEELQYRLYLRQKLEAAEKEIDVGRGLSHEEVVRETDSWFRS